MKDNEERLRAIVETAAITESKHAQAQLTEYAHRLAQKKQAMEDQAQLLDISHDAIFVWREPGGIEYWNRGAVALYGYEPEEARGKAPSELLGTRFPIPVSEVLSTLRTDGVWQGELHHRAKDRRELIVSARFQTVPGSEGSLRVMESAHDITERTRAEAALYESEGRYRTLFESIDEGFCIIKVLFDEQGKAYDYRFLEINPAFEKQSGLTGAIGKTIRELAPKHETHWFEFYGQIALTGTPVRFEQRAEALERFFDVYAFRDGAPEQRRVAVLFTDITRRKKTEEALQRHAQLLEISHDAIFVWRDPGGIIEVWNRGAVELYGYEPDETRGRISHALLKTIHPVPWPQIEAQLRSVGRWEGELIHHTKDGRAITVSSRHQRVPTTDGTLLILESNRDVTAQKRLEREVLDTSAREQRRIGQDLHDDLCQQLASIQLMTGMVADDLSTVAPPEAARISRIAEQVRQTIDRAKRLARGLSPVALESGGLRAGLEELVETSARLFGVRCELVGDDGGDLTQVDIDTGTHLYRIAQEAITNAVKHGRASRLRVHLDSGPEHWVLTVADDGSGCPGQPAEGKGMGLRTMQYRASTIGGSLEVRSSPGRGTSVSCRFPAPAKP